MNGPAGGLNLVIQRGLQEVNNSIVISALAAMLMFLAGCSSPQAFNASQSLDSAVRVFEGNKLSNAVTVLADGQTMSIRSRAEQPFVSLVISDKNGNEVVSVRNAQDFVWQHPVLQAGQARRLIVRLETSSLPTNVVEQWEALVLGDRLVDLDNQLAAFAAGDSAPAPAPRPPVLPTRENPDVQARGGDTVDLGDVASVRPVEPRPAPVRRTEPRRDVASEPVAPPAPPPAQPLSAEEQAQLQRLLERANTAPAPASSVPASAPKRDATPSSDIEEVAPAASALPGAG